MGYIKEDEVLLDEALCPEDLGGYDLKLYKAKLLFRSNIKLANHIAAKYSPTYSGVIDREDIIQEAYLGLWKACLEYDEERGFAFSTYAFPVIRGQILRMYRDSNSLKIPRWFYDIRRSLAEHGFTLPLTDEELDILVAEGKFSRHQLLEYNEPEILSIDAPIKEGDSYSIKEMIADTSALPDSHLSEDDIEITVNAILKYIKPKHRELVEEWIYATLAGEEITQADWGKKYGISQVQVSRTLNSAIDLIKMHRESVAAMLE